MGDREQNPSRRDKEPQFSPNSGERVKYASFFKENGDYVILAIGALVANAIALSFLIENPKDFLLSHIGIIIGSIISIILGVTSFYFGIGMIFKYRKRERVYLGLVLFTFGILLILGGIGLLISLVIV